VRPLLAKLEALEAEEEESRKEAEKKKQLENRSISARVQETLKERSRR